MNKLVALAALVTMSVTSTGCMVGRGKVDKRTSYILNGAVIATGVVVAAVGATDSGGSSECAGPEACYGDYGGGALVSTAIAAAFITGGSIGMIRTLAADTGEDPKPLPVRGTATGTVTAPGLAPATVQLH